MQLGISIHALLAESDACLTGMQSATLHFYPRSPCGERPRIIDPTFGQEVFLSTLSLRRATPGPKVMTPERYYFYPRSPCGERLRVVDGSKSSIEISIHALLAESDTWARGSRVTYVISIHALLAESDSKSAQNSGALLRIWNKFYGDCIFMLTGKAVFYPFCPCFFHIFWCEGTGNFMIAFPSH